MIEVQGISKSFGLTKAVQNVSFKVEKGEVVGFLGPNGAGKSTTMRVLTCYLKADSGSAKIAGFDIKSDSIEVRRRVGYLPENNPLYMDMGVFDYLKFIAQMRHIAKNLHKRKMEKVIDTCGLETVLYKDIGELSKGYRQRLGLAQALIHDPEVLILDEPTIGLDPHQIIEIRNLIKSVGREKTVILSSHILPEVSVTCDRVLIISNGKIAGTGSPSELSAMAKGGQTVCVSVRGDFKEIKGKIEQSEMFAEIRHLGSNDGIHSFELVSTGSQNLSEKVFLLAVENRWTLSELYRKTINLEDVFLDLTGREV